MHKLSPITQQVLERGGWYEGRRADVSSYQRVLETAGYPVHPAVLDFLSQFGGLYFQPPLSDDPRLPQDIYEFHFDAARAASAIAWEQVDELYNKPSTSTT